MGIKAIDTEYDGVLFRSRLEARWAIFLDAMRVRWVYEHEGYHTRRGPYLPDFWLPEQKCWVEIKATMPTDSEVEKCEDVAEGTETAFLLISGSPLNYYLSVYCNDTTDSSGGTQWWEDVRFSRSAEPGNELCIDSRNSRSDREFQTIGWEKLRFMKLTEHCIFDFDNRLKIAVQKAMQARFEHGKTPTKQEVQFG